MTAQAIDLFAGATDPYPLYQELREQQDGVHFVEPVDMWLLLRFEHEQRLITERKRWSSAYFDQMPVGVHRQGDPVHDTYARLMRRNLMLNDAPDHTRLRKLLNHIFTAQALRQWEEQVEILVDELLDTLPVGERFNIFTEVSEVLPLDVIGTVLGVPVSDRAYFRRMSVSFATNLSPGVVDDEQRDRTVKESVELFDYVRSLAEAADRGKLSGLLATLVQAEEDGSKLTMDEVVAQVCMLAVAGNETTGELISTGTALLLQHPDQLALLRERRDLLPSALLEVLRYRAPLQFSPRLTTEDITDLGPTTIPKGSKVLFGHGSMNRDPRQFDRPEEFDIQRGEQRHMAFAAGPHMCIGKPLALMEGRVFFTKFLDRFSSIEWGGDPTPRTGLLAFQQPGWSDIPVIVK